MNDLYTPLQKNFHFEPFYFIRHGETDWNRNHIWMGHTDIPLNPLGIEQAKKAVRSLKNEQIGHIVTSPLVRASQTAEIIASYLKKPLAVIDGLKECGWGKKEGQPLDDGATFQKWLKGQAHEGSERREAFEARVMRSISEALEKKPGPVLIVSHGGVYCAAGRVLGWPFVKLKNGVPIYHRPPEYSNHPWFICPLNPDH